MGSILFIILRLAGLVDSRYDWIILCFLVSLDTAGIPAILGMLKKK
jgi:hypothetical protein